jgi:hypothetical protein
LGSSWFTEYNRLMNPQRFPKTDSIQELAQFFDTHDMTDFDDQFENVEEPHFDLKVGNEITLHLSDDEAKAVRDMAQSRGVPETDLVRAWVLERIHP